LKEESDIILGCITVEDFAGFRHGFRWISAQRDNGLAVRKSAKLASIAVQSSAQSHVVAREQQTSHAN
jgi:hypothetical protein